MKDIAPDFIEVLTILPIEALDEMERMLSSKKQEITIKQAIIFIQNERKSRLKIA